MFSTGIAASTRLPSSVFLPSITPQHSLGNVDSACETIRPKASGSIVIIFRLFVPEGLAQVLRGSVAQDCDDRAGAAFLHQLLRDLAGRVNVRAGGHVDQQALVAPKPPSHFVCVFR